MSNYANLTPASTLSSKVLPSYATFSDVAAFSFPYGIYAQKLNGNSMANGALYDPNFLSGAADQVAHVYKKLGGDILDIELTTGNVFSAYEEATLEYSYLVNLYQGKSVVAQLLGQPTGTFDQNGQMTTGSDASQKFPNFSLDYFYKIGQAISNEAGLNNTVTEYSCSIAMINGQQEYDVYSAISSAVASNPSASFAADFATNKRVRIQKVFYTTPRGIWRFFGQYGGLPAVGNMSNYGQYTDGSTFEVIPVWYHKLLQMNFEDAIKTRTSHFSYEINNNKIKFYPPPTEFLTPRYMWFTFRFGNGDPLSEDANQKNGVNGINNMNSLPFANIPYDKINSMGKHWIRRFALALVKEMLGQVRNKFKDSIPIPGDNVSLNGSELLSQSNQEMKDLREELKDVLDKTTYDNLAEKEQKKIEAAETVYSKLPLPIRVA